MKIGDLKDEFEYQIISNQPYFQTEIVEKQKQKILSLENFFYQSYPVLKHCKADGIMSYGCSLEEIRNIKDTPNNTIEKMIMDWNNIKIEHRETYYINDSIERLGEYPNIYLIQSEINARTISDTTPSTFIEFLNELKAYKELVIKNNISYILRYKKNSYTLDEAKAVLEKKTETFSGSVVVLTQDG